jgi:hypothetical protein
MAVLRDPEEYYGILSEDWSLGDITVVPTAILWERGRKQSNGLTMSAPSPDGTESLVFDLWSGERGMPGVSIEARLTPAMILMDDCAIDKEYNDAVDRLVDQGTDETVAEAIAREDTKLDPIVLVAPIAPYIGITSPQGIRDYQTRGFFPVLTNADAGLGAGESGPIDWPSCFAQRGCSEHLAL